MRKYVCQTGTLPNIFPVRAVSFITRQERCGLIMETIECSGIAFNSGRYCIFQQKNFFCNVFQEGPFENICIACLFSLFVPRKHLIFHGMFVYLPKRTATFALGKLVLFCLIHKQVCQIFCVSCLCCLSTSFTFTVVWSVKYALSTLVEFRHS